MHARPNPTPKSYPTSASLCGRGAAEAGYTLREAAALARSSLPGHRVAACRLLGAVLGRARATPGDALRGALGGAARALEPPAGAAAADVRPRRPARRGTCGVVSRHEGVWTRGCRYAEAAEARAAAAKA